MTDEVKLHLASMQVQNILSLIEGNQYEQYMKTRLITIQVEMNRQLSLISASKYDTIKEQTTN